MTTTYCLFFHQGFFSKDPDEHVVFPNQPNEYLALQAIAEYLKIEGDMTAENFKNRGGREVRRDGRIIFPT